MFTNKANQTSTMCLPDVKKALENGYTIAEGDIYQIYNYSNVSKDLFKDYIKFWAEKKCENVVATKYIKDKKKRIKKLEAKIEDCDDNEMIKCLMIELNTVIAEPEPANSITEKMQIIHDNKHGAFPLDLKLERMVDSPPMKAIAKMMLVSVFGKYGQRTDRSLTKVFITGQEGKFQELIFNPKFKIQDVFSHNDDTLEVKYKYAAQETAPTNNTNSLLAAHITCYGRLML